MFRSASNPVREARQFQGAQYNGPVGSVHNCATTGSCTHQYQKPYQRPVATANNYAATNSGHQRPVVTTNNNYPATNSGHHGNGQKFQGPLNVATVINKE